MHMHGETIWVTGASSGIGLALAKRLAESGNQVIVTARRQDVLDTLSQSHINISVIAADLSQENCVALIQQQLLQKTERLDRVILNAGTCEYFDVDEPDWSMMRRVMDANFVSVVHSVAACLPLLMSNGQQRGHIIGMASLASRVPFPRAEAYGASKAALDYFLGALGVDLSAKGIDVSIVQPGFVKTPLTQKNDFDMPFLMSADKAADAILEGIKRRSLYIRFPRRLHWLLSIGHLLMGCWYRYIGPRLVRAN